MSTNQPFLPDSYREFEYEDPPMVGEWVKVKNLSKTPVFPEIEPLPNQKRKKSRLPPIKTTLLFGGPVILCVIGVAAVLVLFNGGIFNSKDGSFHSTAIRTHRDGYDILFNPGVLSFTAGQDIRIYVVITSKFKIGDEVATVQGIPYDQPKIKQITGGSEITITGHPAPYQSANLKVNLDFKVDGKLEHENRPFSYEFKAKQDPGSSGGGSSGTTGSGSGRDLGDRTSSGGGAGRPYRSSVGQTSGNGHRSGGQGQTSSNSHQTGSGVDGRGGAGGNVWVLPPTSTPQPGSDPSTPKIKPNVSSTKIKPNKPTETSKTQPPPQKTKIVPDHPNPGDGP